MSVVGVRKDNLTTHILCEGGLLCVQSKCIRMECLLPCIINKVPIYTISNIFTFNTDFIHPSINPCNYQCTYKLYSTIYYCTTTYISSSSQLSSLLPLSLFIYLSLTKHFPHFTTAAAAATSAASKSWLAGGAIVAQGDLLFLTLFSLSLTF